MTSNGCTEEEQAIAANSAELVLANPDGVQLVRCPFCGKRWNQTVSGTVCTGFIMDCPSCNNPLILDTVVAVLIRPMEMEDKDE